MSEITGIFSGLFRSEKISYKFIHDLQKSAKRKLPRN